MSSPLSPALMPAIMYGLLLLLAVYFVLQLACCRAKLYGGKSDLIQTLVFLISLCGFRMGVLFVRDCQTDGGLSWSATLSCFAFFSAGCALVSLGRTTLALSGSSILPSLWGRCGAIAVSSSIMFVAVWIHDNKDIDKKQWVAYLVMVGLLIAFIVLVKVAKEVWTALHQPKRPGTSQPFLLRCQLGPAAVFFVATLAVVLRLVVDALELLLASNPAVVVCDEEGLAAVVDAAVFHVPEISLFVLPVCLLAWEAVKVARKPSSDEQSSEKPRLVLATEGVGRVLQLTGWITLIVLAVSLAWVGASSGKAYDAAWADEGDARGLFSAARATALLCTLLTIVVLLGQFRAAGLLFYGQLFGPGFAVKGVTPITIHRYAGMLLLVVAAVHGATHIAASTETPVCQDHDLSADSDPEACDTPTAYESPSALLESFPGLTGVFMFLALCWQAALGCAVQSYSKRRFCLLKFELFRNFHYGGMLLFLSMYWFHGQARVFGIFPFNASVVLAASLLALLLYVGEHVASPAVKVFATAKLYERGVVVLRFILPENMSLRPGGFGLAGLAGLDAPAHPLSLVTHCNPGNLREVELHIACHVAEKSEESGIPTGPVPLLLRGVWLSPIAAGLDFALSSPRVVLLARGVGVTPVLSLMLYLLSDVSTWWNAGGPTAGRSMRRLDFIWTTGSHGHFKRVLSTIGQALKALSGDDGKRLQLNLCVWLSQTNKPVQEAESTPQAPTPVQSSQFHLLREDEEAGPAEMKAEPEPGVHRASSSPLDVVRDKSWTASLFRTVTSSMVAPAAPKDTAWIEGFKNDVEATAGHKCTIEVYHQPNKRPDFNDSQKMKAILGEPSSVQDAVSIFSCASSIATGLAAWAKALREQDTPVQEVVEVFG